MLKEDEMMLNKFSIKFYKNQIEVVDYYIRAYDETEKYGYINIKKIRDSKWYIDILYVLDDYRGTGIAKILLKTALEKCDGTIYLWVTDEYGSDEDRLFKFYEYFGFKRGRDDSIAENCNMIFSKE